MHIEVIWFGNDQFNVNLCAKEGKEAFLQVKGCRIVNGKNGEFVSWPATKNDRTNKWWQHVYASDAFGVAVIEAARKSMPAQDTRTQGQRRQPAHDDDGDIPF